MPKNENFENTFHKVIGYVFVGAIEDAVEGAIENAVEDALNIYEGAIEDPFLIFMTRPTKLEGHYVFASSVRHPSVRKVKTKQDCPRTMAQLPTNLIRLITSTYCISINSIKFCRMKTIRLKL